MPFQPFPGTLCAVVPTVKYVVLTLYVTLTERRRYAFKFLKSCVNDVQSNPSESFIHEGRHRGDFGKAKAHPSYYRS